MIVLPPLHMTHAALPAMRERRDGAIVTIAADPFGARLFEKAGAWRAAQTDGCAWAGPYALKSLLTPYSMMP